MKIEKGKVYRGERGETLLYLKDEKGCCVLLPVTKITGELIPLEDELFALVGPLENMEGLFKASNMVELKDEKVLEHAKLYWDKYIEDSFTSDEENVLVDILDKIAVSPSTTREFYGSEKNKKPNDHCYWSNLEGCWLENDEHLRNRIKEKMRNERNQERH